MRRIDPFLMSFAEQVKEQTAAWDLDVLRQAVGSKITGPQRESLKRLASNWGDAVLDLFVALGRYDLVAEYGLQKNANTYVPLAPFIMIAPMKDVTGHGFQLDRAVLIVDAKVAYAMQMDGEVRATHLQSPKGALRAALPDEIDSFFTGLPDVGVDYLIKLPTIKEQLLSFLTDAEADVEKPTETE